MEKFYSNEKNVLMLVRLLKEHGVRKVVASPGTTNMALVGSLQHDPYFEIYSSVDERSAAYIACGLAEESGEPVVLTCTGATASRNYMSGLTEAYYRKLPILAVTSTQHVGRIGHNVPQVIDRGTQLNDTVKYSVLLPTINSAEDDWACNFYINKALLELNHRGKGPVHINLVTSYSKLFDVKELPETRVIKRYTHLTEFPKIKNKTAILVNSHSVWSEELTRTVDNFCEKYNSLVICDHTSNYKGSYGIMGSQLLNNKIKFDLIIDIGNISGAYFSLNASEYWRVNIDGEIRDTYKKLTSVFEFEEEEFFGVYNSKLNKNSPMTLYNEVNEICEINSSKFPELCFSNLWVASKLSSKLPVNSVLHLGILNSLRSWNFYDLHKSINVYCNTGGFGIDGCLSALMGASLAFPEKLYFGVIGDLALFYDLNVLGNKHFGNNVRLLVINNGCGTEFKNYNHPVSAFADEADKYMAAAGHFGSKSPNLIKNFVEELNFKYMTASSKEEFFDQLDEFTSSSIKHQSIIFEVFTDSQNESDALKTLNSLNISSKDKIKGFTKNMLGDKNINKVKKIFKK